MFSRPEVIGPLKGEFVPFAGDKWYLNRQQDADGAFLRKLGAQREGAGSSSANNGDAPQGIYIAAPDGTLLAADHFHPDPERLLTRMRDARERWQKIAPPARNVAADTGPGTSSADARFARRPPAGGLILKVFSRIPLPPPPGQTWTPNQATGRDHVWLTADEQRALLPSPWKNGVRYPVTAAVAERLVRFHLVDNVRGEPPFWAPGDLRRVDLSLTVENAAAGRLRLEGVARMAAGADRGYDARVQGYLSVDRAKKAITRFDLLAWGEAWGGGTYTRGAPPGRFPLVIAAALVRGDAGADQVPPQASRDLVGYFATGRRVPAASLR